MITPIWFRPEMPEIATEAAYVAEAIQPILSRMNRPLARQRTET